MKTLKIFGVAVVAALTITAPLAANASECGLSCCIAAGVDGVGSATGFTATVQYDTMEMKTILQGTTKVSPDQAIQNALAGKAGMYAVPTKMVMQKISTNLSYRMDENNAFVLSVPYIINDMDMRMGMKMMPASPIMYSNMTMDTIKGIGDASLIYLRDVYKDAEMRTRQRISVGIGIKAPTGKYKSRSASGGLVHMMMQAGTGAWDAVALVNGTLGFGEHADGGAQWLISPSVMYQMNTRNSLGYKVGDRLNYDISARYRFTSAFNAKLDLNGVWAGHDSTDGTVDSVSGLVAYQNPNTMIDNVANTGINSLFVSPGMQWVVTPGFVVSGEYRIPVYQNTRGIQQVTDNWFFLRASVRF